MVETNQATEAITASQKLEIAETTGDFYLSLIDILRVGQLGSNPDALIAKVKRQVADVPPHLQKLYLKGLAGLKTEFENGQVALAMISAKYPETSIAAALTQDALSAEVENGLHRTPTALESKMIHDALDQVVHRQVTPNYHILELPPPLFDLLRKYVKSPGLQGRSLKYQVSSEPLLYMNINFLLKVEGTEDEDNIEFEDPDVKALENHEIHHAILNFLEAQEFVRPNKETGEAMPLFRSFRHEVAGYLISCITSFDAHFKPQWSIDSKFGEDLSQIQDDKIKTQAQTAIVKIEEAVNQLIDDSVEGWYKPGFSLKALLMPCLTASTFSEVLSNFDQMIELINQKYRYTENERDLIIQDSRSRLAKMFSPKQSVYDNEESDPNWDE